MYVVWNCDAAAGESRKWRRHQETRRQADTNMRKQADYMFKTIKWKCCVGFKLCLMSRFSSVGFCGKVGFLLVINMKCWYLLCYLYISLFKKIYILIHFHIRWFKNNVLCLCVYIPDAHQLMFNVINTWHKWVIEVLGNM